MLLLGRLRLLGFLVFIGVTGHCLAQNPETRSADSLFGLNRVTDFRLELTPAEWEKLQVPENVKITDWAIFSVFGDIIEDAKNGRDFHSARSTRPGLAGYLGIDHQYGRGQVTIDGDVVKNVGIRYKGNGTFVEGYKRGKLSFKIDFGEYDDSLQYHGLNKINLHSNVTDPSLLREPLSYEMFRAAGVPCSGVGYARVTVAVPGEVAWETHQVYSVVEQIDKGFLKRRLGSDEGLLLKPSTFRIFPHFGDDWERYEKAYVAKTSATPEQKRRLIEFSRLLHYADDAAFADQIESYVDLDQFLRFLAVNVLLSNLDSFLGSVQNYYVYLNPITDKFQFFPWDMDHSFGVFPLKGNPYTRRQLSIDHPQTEDNSLIRRVLEIPAYRDRYHRLLDEFLTTFFTQEKIEGLVSRTTAFIDGLRPPKPPKTPSFLERILGNSTEKKSTHPIVFFVAERRKSVLEQLRGESQGAILSGKR